MSKQRSPILPLNLIRLGSIKMVNTSFIDLSICIENGVKSDPDRYLPRIEYVNHDDSSDDLVDFFPGISPEDMPNGEAWALENISLTTHNGTHLDAPYHYGSKMLDGSPTMTIDEVPLHWCFRPGVKLDFTSKSDGYVVTAADIQEELDRIDHELSPLEIVLMNTSAGGLFGTDEYVNSGCGFGREATLHLLEKGVKITGTDAWSWDAPFIYTAKKYASSRDASIIWEGHKTGLEIQYCHLEKLHNLNLLPDKGFMVSCFPTKIKGGSAGWTRAVAIIDTI